MYCDDHQDLFDFEFKDEKEKRIHCTPKEARVVSKGLSWRLLQIKLFAKVEVSMRWKDEPPIDVKVWLKGPWMG